jgi:hypothetical protein
MKDIAVNAGDGWVKGTTTWHVFTSQGFIPCKTNVPLSHEVWPWLPKGAVICRRCRPYLTRKIVEE